MDTSEEMNEWLGKDEKVEGKRATQLKMKQRIVELFLGVSVMIQLLRQRVKSLFGKP